MPQHHATDGDGSQHRARRHHLAAFAGTFALLAPPAPGGVAAASAGLVPAVGLSLEVAGFALAGWARATLGRHWAGRVALTADQPLVHTGPYRLVRHLLYVGLLAAVLGQALVLLAAAYRRTVGYEEAALRRHFGTAYEDYAATIPMLLPARPRGTPSRRGLTWFGSGAKL